MKKKASIIMSLSIFILLALSFNQNNLDISTDSQITTEEDQNQISDFSNQNYIPRNSANFDPGAKYEWWSSNWTFRIPLAVNSTYINRTDFSVKANINFTEFLNHPDLNRGELDVNSIRVVEYEESSLGFAAMYISNDSYSDLRKYLNPSRFIPTKDEFDATDNATGIVWFEMSGLSESNTNRTFMVYFDSIENGPKDIDELNIIWNTKYNKNTDVVGDNQFHLAYGSIYRDTGLGGELTIWNENLQTTMGNPSTKWGNVEYYYLMAPGDFNGDGNVELVVSDAYDDFAVIDYDEETEQWGEIWDGAYRFRNLHNYTYTRHYNILAYDMDNDGKDEIVAGNYWDTSHPESFEIIVYGFNKTAGGSQELVIENNLSTSESYSAHIALADLNQDGWMDIITGSYGGPVSWQNKSYYFISNQGQNYTRYQINYPVSGLASNRRLPQYCYSIKAADIDYDGKIEVLYSQNDGRIYLWEWNGTHLEFKANIDTQMGNPNYGVVGEIEDWDQDGRLEILMGNWDSSVPTALRVYEIVGDNQINVTVDEWETNNLDYTRCNYPIFGDPDNDGEIEIATGSAYGPLNDYDGKVSVWEYGSETNAEWLSSNEGQYIGKYYVRSSSMLQIFGDYDSRIARMEPDYQIYTPQIKPPDLTIQVFDVDKGPVPGLGVILDNESESYSESLFTDSKGKVQFTDLLFVSYELNISIENQMGNRSVFIGEILINKTRESITVNSTLWKISFIIEDKNENRLNYGVVDFYNETQGDNVNSSKDLASDGTCSFYWFEKSSGPNEYNYSIDYANSFYSPETTRIYENSITQQDLNSTEDWFNSTNSYADDGPDNYYTVFNYYARDSKLGTSGDKMLNWVNIDISGVSDYIYKVELNGIYQDHAPSPIITYLDDYGSSFQLEHQFWNYTEPVIGIQLKVFVHNTTQNDGIINVSVQETFVERVQVDLFQRKITLWDQYDFPLENAIVQIFNNDTKSLVNLTTNGIGEALDDNGVNFWYLIKDGGVVEGNYTMKIKFFDDFQYFKESTEDWGQMNNHTNFSLTIFEEKIYNVNLDSSKFSTEIEVISSNYMDPLNYKDTLNITVNITAYDQDEDIKFSINPDVLGLSFRNSTGDGVYLNSSFKQAGTGIYECLITPFEDNIPVIDGDNQFTIWIFAETPGYGNDPDPFIWILEILPIDTTLSLYNGSTQIIDTLDVYLGIEFDITLIYEDLGQDLAEATSIIDWEYADNELMLEQSGGGFTNYTFLINTSKDVRLGTYILEFSASLTNYTTSTTIIQLNVLEIPTTVQSTTTSPTSELLLINKNISETDVYLFNFRYFDVYHGENIANAECYYSWNKIETGEFGSNIPMIISGDGTINTLDFNTKNLTEGSYNIIVTLTKTNYQQRQALIYLTIEKRVISYAMVGDFDGSNSIVKVSGNELEFSVDLKDEATGNSLLNASVTITFKDGKESIILDDKDGDGIYTATKTFSKGEINAFFRDNNFQGTLEISADHYATVEKDISITIKMDELIDGIPTFYLLIAIGAVLILVGSLAGYKLVQVSKIPAFVKLINKLEKQISGNKEVLRDNMTLTMEEEMIKRFKDEWAILDYDIKEVLKSPTEAEDFSSPTDDTGGI